MTTLEFVLPDGSPDPCPNACGRLTEDPYGGPCKACWAEVDNGCGDPDCGDCEDACEDQWEDELRPIETIDPGGLL